MKRNRNHRMTRAEREADLNANRAADAYNAGWRAADRGKTKGGRYVHVPEYDEGYADRLANREPQD